jgi:hypothetical protein
VATWTAKFAQILIERVVNLGQPSMERSVSVIDQFRTAEQRVAERLRELKPLVDEYHALEQVAQRLGLKLNEDATAADKQRPASPKGTQERRRDSKTNARWSTSSREESGDDAAAKPSAATTPRRPRASRRTGDSGRPGSNRTSRRQPDVLRLVNQRAGITVSQWAAALGGAPAV